MEMPSKGKPWLGWIIPVIATCAGLLAAFAAGIWYSPRMMVPFPSWLSYEACITLCPPPEGDLHGTRDFIRANEAVAAYLNGVDDKPEHEGLHLLYIGIPSDHGYEIYYSSGNPSREFPQKLLEDLDRIFEEAIRASDGSS